MRISGYLLHLAALVNIAPLIDTGRQGSLIEAQPGEYLGHTSSSEPFCVPNFTTVFGLMANSVRACLGQRCYLTRIHACSQINSLTCMSNLAEVPLRYIYI